MSDKLPITHDQFKDAVRRLLFKKPNPDAVSEDYEPTEEELEEVYRVESEPSDKESPYWGKS